MTGDRRRPISLLVAIVVLGLLGAGVPPIASAARLEVQAELDRSEIGVGEAAMLMVTVTAEGMDVPPITLPEIQGAEVQRLGESQGFSWINGRVTRNLTVGFRLRPNSAGELTIPAIRVSSAGTEAQSAPLTLTVGKSRPKARAGTPELFVRLILDRDRVYWNEGIPARFILYTRVRLAVPPAWDPPDAAGFWREVLGPARTERVTVLGIEYDASEIRVVYFPTRTGKLTLGPGRVHLQAVRRIPQPGPWSALGLPETQIEELTLETEQSTVDVMPLPPGAPDCFKGGVGDYTMDVRVDRASARAGEPVTVSTFVRGEGNLASAGDPDVATSAPARIFAGGVSTTLNRTGSRLRGERRRDTTFVPEAPGAFAILPVRFSWFDAESGRYRTQTSDTIRITVLPAGPTGDSLHASGVVGPIALLRSKPGRSASLSLDPPPGSRAIALASLLAFGGASAARRIRQRMEQDPRRRRGRALDLLLAELHRIERENVDGAIGAVRIGSIVQRALGLRYNADIEGHPVQEALDRARSSGAPEEDLSEVVRVLESLDRLAYAPPDFDSARETLEREAAERLIRRYREELD